MHVQPLTVVGLRLALPRNAVKSILDWSVAGDAAGTQFAGKIAQTGLVAEAPGLRVVDTARLVVPRLHPRYDQLVARRCYKKVVVLGEGEWGLACDATDEDVILPASTLCWRDATAQEHPWLAATFRDYGYALIDATRLLRLA